MQSAWQSTSIRGTAEALLVLGGLVQLKADEAQFYKEQEEYKQKHRMSWEVDIEEKRRLTKMLADKETFENAIKERRATEFAALQVTSRCISPPY